MTKQSYSLILSKYILLTLLLSTQLFAYEKNKPMTIYGYVSEKEKLHGKVKAMSYLNDYGKVKLMVYSLMVGKQEAKNKKIDIDYITNIKVKADDKLLYNVNLSPCIAENPLLKFFYKDIKPLSLTLESTNNNRIIKSNTIKVKHTNEIKQIPKLLKLSAKGKSYPNQIESIKNLFGDINLIEGKIQLTVPRLAENAGSIPINIRSDIKFKSIALFMKIRKDEYYTFAKNCGKETGFNLVSQWFATPYSLTNFDIRIKMRNHGEVLVVLEAKNGKFYTVKQEVDISIGGRDAGG